MFNNFLMNELINIDWKKKICITADLYFDTQCHNFGYSIMYWTCKSTRTVWCIVTLCVGVQRVTKFWEKYWICHYFQQIIYVCSSFLRYTFALLLSNQCCLSDEKSCVLDNTVHLVLVDDVMFIPLIISKDIMNQFD